MSINLPGFDSKPNSFIQGTEVSFKAVEGLYNYYDKEKAERVETKDIEGVVIGVGFKFDTMVGKPTSKKSTKLVSDEFGYSFFNGGKIKMKKLYREGEKFEASNYGEKTYTEWKEDGQRLTKIVYIMDSKDTNKIYKLQFAGMAFGEITKLISKDAPNFINKFSVSEKPTETDNGDFFLPTVIKGKVIPESLTDKVIEQIKFIDSILTKTALPTIETGATAEEAKATFDAEELPF